MPHLGPWELGIILVIVIAIFGAGKLAGLGGALGKGVRDFRSAVREGSKEEKTDEEPAEAKASAEAEKEE